MAKRNYEHGYGRRKFGYVVDSKSSSKGQHWLLKADDKCDVHYTVDELPDQARVRIQTTCDQCNHGLEWNLMTAQPDKRGKK